MEIKNYHGYYISVTRPFGKKGDISLYIERLSDNTEILSEIVGSSYQIPGLLKRAKKEVDEILKKKGKKMEELKQELLKLVRDHKNRCDGTCNISLLQIRLKAEKVGMCFTEDEKKEMI